MFTFANANNFNNANAFDVTKNLNAHMFVAPINNVDDANNIIKSTIEFCARVLIAYTSFKILSFILFGFASALTISFGFSFKLFAWMFNMLWDNLTEGQQWIEIAFMVSSIAVTAAFLKLIHDENMSTDNYIDKLKAQLAAKDAMIAQLSSLLEELKDIKDEDADADADASLDDEYDEKDDWETISSSSTEYDDADDSDYNPDDDEY
jgi:hypothetical protein